MRKRFYKQASVERQGDEYLVVLDGRPAKTLQRHALAAPSRALAEAIAMEWNAQDEKIDRSSMMLTALANSAIDHVSRHRGAVIEHSLGFGRSDLLCYRADESDLAGRQAAMWDPLLVWAHAEHGIRFETDKGITFVEQPVDTLLRMQEIVADLDDFALVAFDAAASLAGSFVIALALVKRRLNADEAFAAAQLDELYQVEKWGRDAEAEQRRQRLLNELKAIERLVHLLSRD